MFLKRLSFLRSPFRSGGSERSSRRRMTAVVVAGALLAACQADETIYGYGPKEQRPVSQQTREAMTKLGVSSSSPVLMRIFKEESAFEVWKMDRTGRYVLLRTFQICRWSGNLGPKVREGDRQAPEGFYPISPGLLNPKSDWYLAFNTGFPNAYDRANNRTGTALMVHGSCSSRGCYAMTDAQIQDIYALARDAFNGGQKAFQLQAFPFHLTAENMAKHWNDPNMPFWKMLKEGYDTFELTHQEPKVDVCGRKYVFNANPASPLDTVAPCPADLHQPADLVASLAAKAKADEDKAQVMFAELDKKRRDEEDKKVQLALAAEEKKKRDEQRRLEAARNPSMLASLFATAPAKDPDEVGVAVGPVVVPATGAPMPAADPRGPQLHMLALAEPQPPAATASQSSIAATFTKLFSFSSSESTAIPEVATPAPTTFVPPAAAPTALPAGAPVASGGLPGVPATSTALTGLPPVTAAVRPAKPDAAPAVTQPQALPATTSRPQPTPICVQPGTINPPANVPVCPSPPPVVAEAPAAPAPAKSIIDRIGSWF